jgi:signal transduction histidine kinase
VNAIADNSGETSLRNLELPFRTKSGELRQALISAETEEIEGEPCLIVTTRDITERRRAEEEARDVSSKLITAQEDERKRIAHDLHDDLNQRLALLSVEMDLLAQEAGTNREFSLRHIKVIAGRVREMSAEVHKLSYQLHPAKLDQLGLVVAARTFCREVSRQSGIAVHFEQQDVPRDLNGDIALCLYRVIQEALQNSIRHSGGAPIQVKLGCAREQIHLLISDEGKGFDVSHAMHNGGLGLVSMRERVRQVNGSIRFTSARGNGTRIEVTAPLPALDGRASSVPI